MFDYLSIELDSRIIDVLLGNTKLCFTTPINEETGELIPDNYYFKKKVAICKGFRFTIKTNLKTGISKLILDGSIHKYFTGGVNHTDFDQNALRTALNSLESEFNIKLNQSKIHSIEFGVNVRLPFSCRDVIENLLYYINTKPGEYNFDGKGQMTKFIMSQYIVKIYNKSLQYFSIGNSLVNADNLLRFEIHVDKMQYLINKGINLITPSDLLNPEIQKRLGELLVSTFKDFVINENVVNTSRINPNDIQFLKDANNPNYWHNLRKDGGPKTFSRKLDKFRSLQHKYNEKTVLDIIVELIKIKWGELTANVPKLPSVENSNMSQYYPYIVGNIRTTIEKRYKCKVTGLDITNQSGKRNYLSEQSLDRIEYKNPGLYYKLLLEFGPKVYNEKVNTHITHNIRNRFTNKYHNIKRRAVRSLYKTAFFRGDEVMTLTEQQKKIIFTYK